MYFFVKSKLNISHKSVVILFLLFIIYVSAFKFVQVKLLIDLTIFSIEYFLLVLISNNLNINSDTKHVKKCASICSLIYVWTKEHIEAEEQELLKAIEQVKDIIKDNIINFEYKTKNNRTFSVISLNKGIGEMKKSLIKGQLDNKYRIPKELTNENKEELVIAYIKSDAPNLNYLRLIMQETNSSKLKLKPSTKIMARQKYKELYEKYSSRFMDFGWNIEVSFPSLGGDGKTIRDTSNENEKEFCKNRSDRNDPYNDVLASHRLRRNGDEPQRKQRRRQNRL